jgi:hypothetical protein
LGRRSSHWGDTSRGPAAGARFNFEVDDVDAWWARIGPSADVVEELFDTAYGTRNSRSATPTATGWASYRQIETWSGMDQRLLASDG